MQSSLNHGMHSSFIKLGTILLKYFYPFLVHTINHSVTVSTVAILDVGSWSFAIERNWKRKKEHETRTKVFQIDTKHTAHTQICSPATFNEINRRQFQDRYEKNHNFFLPSLKAVANIERIMDSNEKKANAKKKQKQKQQNISKNTVTDS